MSRRRNSESGFALLLIFVLAAGIAISMLMQLPRVAFETARNREEMLIERGEQYKRAIALFFRKNNRLPQKIEDLENTNNIRFLRRRYRDPMTGKDEWRVVHAGPGGVLTDSLVQKAPGTTPDGKGGTQSAQNLMNPGNTVGTGATPDADGGVNPFARRDRPSDRVAMPGQVAQNFDPSQAYPSPSGGYPGLPGGNVQGGQPIYPGQPGYPQPGTPGYTGQPIYPGQPGNAQIGMGQGNVPQQPIYPGQPGYPQPGTPGYTGQPLYPGQPGYPSGGPGMAQPQPIYPGQPGYPQPGTPGYTGQPLYPGQPGYPQTGNVVQGQPIYPGQPGYPQPGTPGYTGAPIYPGQSGYPPGQGFNPMQNVPGVAVATPGGFGQPQMPQQMPQGGFSPGGGGFSAQGPQGGTAPGNQAVSMINDLLRNPRNPPPGVGGAFNNTGIQGGIAGFASLYKGPSIKIYKERQKYQEWEFVYDIKDDPYLKRGAQGSTPGLGNVQPGNTGRSGFSGSGPQPGPQPGLMNPRP